MDTSKVTNPRDANLLTRAYFDSILVESRYIDSCVPDTTMELFGRSYSSPIMIAAFSHLGGHHPGGMPEMARGAALANICNWAGMGSREELRGILDTGAGTIKIIKPYADRRAVIDMIHFAEEQGAAAVGIDIDHSFNSKGEPDFVLGHTMQPVTSEELRMFVKETSLPFVIKGVLSIRDAAKCAEAGVRGILISHHHGILPYAVPPLMALPRIKAAVGSSMDIFVDCGIDSGCDAFKCLAMGAKAVCVGRSILPAFHDCGAEGVRDSVTAMNDELRAMMARTGCKDLSSIPGDLLWSAQTGQPL